jgi:hypothetical protein
MEVSASVAVERLLDLNWGFVGEREGCNFRERVTREKFTYYCCLLSLISIYKIVWIKSLGGSKCEANQTSGGLLTFSVPKRCHFERDVFRPPFSSSSSSVEGKTKNLAAYKLLVFSSSPSNPVVSKKFYMYKWISRNPLFCWLTISTSQVLYAELRALMISRIHERYH